MSLPELVQSFVAQGFDHVHTVEPPRRAPLLFYRREQDDAWVILGTNRVEYLTVGNV